VHDALGQAVVFKPRLGRVAEQLLGALMNRLRKVSGSRSHTIAFSPAIIGSSRSAPGPAPERSGWAPCRPTGADAAVATLVAGRRARLDFGRGQQWSSRAGTGRPPILRSAARGVGS
jgi:hypothetical protein